jgi:hypothetical protein
MCNPLAATPRSVAPAPQHSADNLQHLHSKAHQTSVGQVSLLCPIRRALGRIVPTQPLATNTCLGNFSPGATKHGECGHRRAKSTQSRGCRRPHREQREPCIMGRSRTPAVPAGAGAEKRRRRRYCLFVLVYAWREYIPSNTKAFLIVFEQVGTVPKVFYDMPRGHVHVVGYGRTFGSM